jgi:hypothetical protein
MKFRWTHFLTATYSVRNALAMTVQIVFCCCKVAAPADATATTITITTTGKRQMSAMA